MSVNFDIQARAEGLAAELNDDISSESRRAKRDHWIAVLLMAIALATSFAAGLGGLALGWTAQNTAIVAFIPGAIGIIATTMNFEGKSNWHYRKLYGLSSLKSRLRFELPLAPSVDNIAAVSKAHRELIAQMSQDWEAGLSLSWSHFKPHQQEKPGARGS